MARYTVPFTTWVNTSVELDVPDNVTDPTEIAELAEQKLYETGAPGLCHQCAGGRRYGSHPLEIGDVWEVPTHDGAMDIARTDQQETPR